jgi:hypothetical protein
MGTVLLDTGYIRDRNLEFTDSNPPTKAETLAVRRGGRYCDSSRQRSISRTVADELRSCWDAGRDEPI